MGVLLGALPANFPAPLLIVPHISADAGDGLARLLDARCPMRVKEADERELITPGTAYIAPPNYHLLVEKDGSLSFSEDPPVSYARPSIDVLFESAVDVFGPDLVGVILTGANFDGSRGLNSVKRAGGIAIVQDPKDAEAEQMPLAALQATEVDYVVALDGIAPLLQKLVDAGANTLGQEECHV